MWKYLTTINWYKIGRKFQTVKIFQYSAHAHIQNTLQNAKKAEKHENIWNQ